MCIIIQPFCQTVYGQPYDVPVDEKPNNSVKILMETLREPPYRGRGIAGLDGHAHIDAVSDKHVFVQVQTQINKSCS